MEDLLLEELERLAQEAYDAGDLETAGVLYVVCGSRSSNTVLELHKYLLPYVYMMKARLEEALRGS